MSERQQRKKCAQKRQHGNKLTSPFLNWDGGGIMATVRCCYGNWDRIRAGPHTQTKLELKREERG